MSERFCPVCGRANRSDLPRCMNCGQRMMPSAPVDGGRSVLLRHEDDEAQTVASQRTGTHTPWWQTPDGTGFGSIPPPPQVKEEMERFAAREEAKASVARAEEAAKEATLAHERKKAAAALARSAAAVARANKGVPTAIVHSATFDTPAKSAAGSPTAAQVECVRCGTAPPSGGGFSFCLSCGGDLTPGTTAFKTGSVSTPSAVRPVTSTHSVSAPNNGASNGGLRMQQADAKTGNSTGIVSITSVTTTTTHTSSFPPAVAALMSFFVPGLGQIVNGQIGKGVVLLLASFFVSAILAIPTMGLFPLLGRIVAAVDAYRIAEKRRKGAVVRPDEWDV